MVVVVASVISSRASSYYAVASLTNGPDVNCLGLPMLHK